jgi:hypothetical protein
VLVTTMWEEELAGQWRPDAAHDVMVHTVVGAVDVVEGADAVIVPLAELVGVEEPDAEAVPVG